MNIGTPTKAQLAELRIAREYLDVWFQKHRNTWGQIRMSKAIWKTAEGRVPLTLAEIEDLIAAEDPVVWAWLNLVEKQTVTIDGEVVVRRGDPWALFPIQGELARCPGDLIVECGAEVGKTRDIVLRTLWRADTVPGCSSMIGGDSDQTLIPLWEELEYQLEQNPLIAGGLVEEKCHIKPNRKKVFRNGSEIELRLAGHDGKNFRGGHFSDGLYADEAVKWKNPQQWSEFWRSGLPGSFARIYSTPDGDYSSPFYAMASRAVPVNGPRALLKAQADAAAVIAGEGASGLRRFRKFQISKRQLPAPFWSDKRAAVYREQFGGEDSIGWITNVDGAWGSPSYSVFPMTVLNPCLKYLEHYRVVVALVDRDRKEVMLAAAKLNPTLDTEEGAATPETILFRETVPLAEGRDGRLELARQIAAFFPDIRGWVSPKLVCGGDLGSAQDPTELLFSQVAGPKWTDLFRLHLRRADWLEQAEIVVALDHASGHRARYSFDNGSAGSALIQGLTGSELYRSCPECESGNGLYLAERLVGRGFGESIDAFDPETGDPILNPDDKDASGNMRPLRLSNKEFSTRILERKLPKREIEIARDAGAGDVRLAAAQLMVNHTASGRNRRGERNFRGDDDHHVDARRQMALAIVSELRGDGFVQPDPEEMAVSGVQRTSFMGGGSVISELGLVSRLGADFFD